MVVKSRSDVDRRVVLGDDTPQCLGFSETSGCRLLQNQSEFVLSFRKFVALLLEMIRCRLRCRKSRRIIKLVCFGRKKSSDHLGGS